MYIILNIAMDKLDELKRVIFRILEVVCVSKAEESYIIKGK